VIQDIYDSIGEDTIVKVWRKSNQRALQLLHKHQDLLTEDLNKEEERKE
jgi:hypothetical protein